MFIWKFKARVLQKYVFLYEEDYLRFETDIAVVDT